MSGQSVDPKESLRRDAAWYLNGQLEVDRLCIQLSFAAIESRLKGPAGLELGPAEGQMTQLLVRKFESLTVVDAAAELLAHIPTAPNLTKVECLFEEYEPAGRFDTILLMQVLPILIDPVVHLKRFRGWLAPGGRLIVEVPNALSIHRLAATRMGLLEKPSQLSERDATTGNRRVYDHATLRADLEAADLRVKSIEGLFLKPLSNQQIQDTWTPAMIRAFFELGRDFPDNAALLLATCSSD